MTDMSNIGDACRNRREELDWSQEELANRVSRAFGAKVSQQNIGQLEIGRVKRPRYLNALAQVLGLTPDWMTDRRPPQFAAEAAIGTNHISEEEMKFVEMLRRVSDESRKTIMETLKFMRLSKFNDDWGGLERQHEFYVAETKRVTKRKGKA